MSYLELLKTIQYNNEYQYNDISYDQEVPLLKSLQNFVSQNENPKSSPNLRTSGRDNYSKIISLLIDFKEREEIVLYALKTLKILSRKSENRRDIDVNMLEAVTYNLNRPMNPNIASEAANIILNICYERENVRSVIKKGTIVSLLAFLSAEDSKLQAAAAGAIQSICFQKEGKDSLKDLDGISSILPLLKSPSATVKSRVVGTLHNLSSDLEVVGTLRKLGAIKILVSLLNDSNSSVVASAAGCIQNISREDLCRAIIRQSNAVPMLTNLLFSEHTNTQVCAAGALLNLLGPDYGEYPGGEDRKGLKKILSLSMSLGILLTCMEESSQT